MQLIPTTTPHRFRRTLQGCLEKPTTFYSGLSASLTRQLTYTTLRLGLFTKLTQSQANLTFQQRLSIGFFSGGIASFLANPVEVSMVRMYEGSRGYRNVGHALWRIGKDEGIRGLWRGCGATVGRSAIVNAVQLGVYDQAKQVWRKEKQFEFFFLAPRSVCCFFRFAFVSF